MFYKYRAYFFVGAFETFYIVYFKFIIILRSSIRTPRFHNNIFIFGSVKV